MMLQLSRAVAVAAMAVSLVHAAPAAPERRLVLPDQDPFYQPPAGFESEAPGTVLRNRPIIAAFFGFIPDPIEAHQLLYRTNSINGSAIAAVTTVFKPLFAKNDRFVSFQTAYDSGNTKCQPSYSYQLGSLPYDLITNLEQLTMQAYLLSGYIVSSSDYEGPDAAFTPGHLEGRGTLDSMRAVINFGKTLGLSTNKPMIVGTGYSGGAIATGWAASLQPTYAPELNIKGWVGGGTPANLTATLIKVDNTLFSGFLPIAIDGIVAPSAYGAEVGALVDQIATPAGKKALDFAKSNCIVASILAFTEKSIFSTDFQSLGEGLLTEPRIAKILLDNTMGINKTETPTAPVLLYHASQDEIVAYEPIPTLYKNWCANGASVRFSTYDAGGHGTTEVIGLPEAVTFTNNAFAGTLPKGCSEGHELSDSLNPLALGLDLEPLLVQLAEYLLAFGKQDANLKKDPSILGQPPP